MERSQKTRFVKKRKNKKLKKLKIESNGLHDTLRDRSLTAQQNLRILIIIGQPEIKSLDPIAQLCNLEELWVVECKLKVIVLLQKCNLLERLYLYANEIETLPDFSNLKKLNVLSLARNRLNDLKGVRELINLQDLNVADNRISNLDDSFSPESKLVHVNLSNNPIQDMQDIENLWLLKNLQKLEFDDPMYGKCPLTQNHLNYREYLVRHFPGLEEIDHFPIHLKEREKINSNEISINKKMMKKYEHRKLLDMKFIIKVFNSDEFSHIKHLKLVDCSISQDDLQSIFLPQLESLDLSKNILESLQGLKNMEKLHTLCVSENRIGACENHSKESSSPEKTELPSVNVFYADHNKISSIDDKCIPNMPSLKYIFMQHNNIHNVNGIENFRNVRTLVLDNNEIENIEDQFRYNVYLKILFLENNRLTSLEFIKKIRNLEKLFIANNKIQDIGELSHLGGFKNLSELRIYGNPFCNESNYFREIRSIAKTIKKLDGHSTT